MKNLTKLSPEGFDIANAYIEYGGDITLTAEQLQIPRHMVSEAINKPDVKRYIDNVYLDLGYRNRNKIASTLDRIIEIKLQEAEESEMYTSKDIIDLLTLAHKMRMDELKLQKPENTQSTTVQIANSFGDTGYGKLMEKLINAN